MVQNYNFSLEYFESYTSNNYLHFRSLYVFYFNFTLKFFYKKNKITLKKLKHSAFEGILISNLSNFCVHVLKVQLEFVVLYKRPKKGVIQR